MLTVGCGRAVGEGVASGVLTSGLDGLTVFDGEGDALSVAPLGRHAALPTTTTASMRARTDELCRTRGPFASDLQP